MDIRGYFRNKALEILVAGLCAVAVGYISLNFVSNHVYASDQAELIKAIKAIAPALSREIEIDRIQREIREVDHLRQRLIRYRDADPDSPLATARQQEIDALIDQKQQLQIELDVAMRKGES